MRRVAITEENIETRFLANMSHEIRTPMNSIMGFIELVLEDETLSDQHRSNLMIALKSSKNLLALINNILDITKLESGTIHPTIRDFDLSVLLTTIENRWKTVAAKKQVSFSVECDQSLHGTYRGDSQILEKILFLIIDNALKFTEHGTVKVTVGTGMVQDTLAFSIEDTGIGIHPSFIEEIFDPFMQGDSTNSRSYEGVGLGATLAQRFTELLSGDLCVESTYGTGTTVTVTVPIVKSNEVASFPLLDSEEKPGQGDRKFKILLVDDIETNLELARVHLHRRGQDVETALNGLEALDASEVEDFDVILMDIHMPVMNGIHAMEEIRKREGNEKHTIIIALTADQMSDVRIHLLEKGFDDVIGKPVNFEALMEMLQSSLPQDRGVPLFKPNSTSIEETLLNSEISVSNSESLEELLQDALTGLGQYNPSKVSPILEELQRIIGENRLLESTVTLVESFEFDRAEHELKRLAHSLDIELE